MSVQLDGKETKMNYYTNTSIHDCQGRKVYKNRRQPEKPSMALIALVTIAFVAAVTFAISNLLFVGDHDEKKFDGIQTSVRWEYVNLRQNHDVGSEAIDQLHMGEHVELTSKVFEAWDAEWIYVRSEKGNGWVVTASLYQPE